MSRSYVHGNLHPKCYVCDQAISISGKDIFASSTEYTNTLISDLLGQFVGHELIKASDTNLACEQCVNRINEYDFACFTAKQAQQELTMLLNATEEKYFQKVVFLCDDVKEEGENPVSMIDIIETDELSPVHNIKDELDVSLQKIDCLEEDTDEYEIQFYSADTKTTQDGLENSENDNNEEFIYKTVFCDSQEETKERDENEDELLRPVSSGMELRTSMKNATKRAIMCRPCNIEFESRKTLREHRKAAHQSVEDSLICDICGMSYKTRAALKIHVALHQGISPFECPICHKQFTQKGALKRHEPIHTGVRPYQCEKCGKQFIHYSSFHMHNLAHADVRDKKCEICGLMLRSSSHLNRHMLVHTGLKPHTCPKCGKSFAQRYNMTSHLRSHQGIQRKRKHACPICGRGFSRESLLLSHVTSKVCSPDESNITTVYEPIDQPDE